VEGKGKRGAGPSKYSGPEPPVEMIQQTTKLSPLATPISSLIAPWICGISPTPLLLPKLQLGFDVDKISSIVGSLLTHGDSLASTVGKKNPASPNHAGGLTALPQIPCWWTGAGCPSPRTPSPCLPSGPRTLPFGPRPEPEEAWPLPA